MTYSVGGLIQATDYNGFVSTTVGANVNGIWATGSTDSGYGETALSTVSTAGTVTATQWASLVNTISTVHSLVQYQKLLLQGLVQLLGLLPLHTLLLLPVLMQHVISLMLAAELNGKQVKLLLVIQQMLNGTTWLIR
jgi:hypothetical protein